MFFTQARPADHPNKKWEVLFEQRALTIRNNKIFRPTQAFFTIGSCFAEELRKALTKRNVLCYPEYRRIAFDPSRARVDNLPEREHMNYYNTFSIRQEFERATDLWVQDREDIWKIGARDIQDGKLIVGSGHVYQDPYRRLVFGRSADDLWEAIDQVNVVMKAGLIAADVCIITLGMTEVFKKKNNHLVCNEVPVYGAGAVLRETYFHPSTYEENMENMRVSLQLLKKLNERIQVVLTVSPVPLNRSFNEHDIFINNSESKAILRAVVARICREYDWVHYFPAFEIVSGIGSAAYQDVDLLHVKEDIVGNVIDLFLLSHFIQEQQA